MPSRSERAAVRLSAVVVAFGKDEFLTDCVSALGAALANVDGETELVVVANSLSDSGRERLRRLAPAAVLVAGTPRLGFAGGVTAGIAAARGSWIAVVNDDCVVQPDALAELLATGERRREVGSVAASIRFAARPDIVNSAGIEIDELGVARERRLGQPVSAVESQAVEVFGASATLALYRRRMLDEVGAFDASFFAYLEDADLAWRARLAGWSCLLAPRAVAFHRHSATLGHRSGAKHRLVGRNRVRMLAKNADGRLLRRRLPAILAYDLLHVAYVAAVDRTPAPLAGRLEGLREWRAYRAAGRPHRRALALTAPPGIRAALRRNRVYRVAVPVRPTSRAEPVGAGRASP
jgi:GT2 family glycosyltransferase